GVVLLCAVDVVGEVVVGANRIELRGRLVIFRTPAAAAIEGHGSAAVVRVHHALVVLGVDPQPVIVAVRRADLAPGSATIGRFVDAASRPDLVNIPRRTQHLPRRGVHNTRVARIHAQIHRSRLVIDEENLLPGLAAILRAEDAPLGIRAIGVTDGGNIYKVGIVWIHPDTADLAGVAQSYVLPGASGVSRFVHAIAVRDVRTQ